MKRKRKIWFEIAVLLSVVCFAVCSGIGCTRDIGETNGNKQELVETLPSIEEQSTNVDGNRVSFDTTQIPDFQGEKTIIVNNDEPFFLENEKQFHGTFIELSNLDGLGRCGVANACVGQETKPSDDREDISSVYPSGWKQLKLSDGTWLYNRSHLLMFALTGLNDDERNLITGTREFNASTKSGMLAWETMVKYVVDNYNAHVLYRVTPVYNGNDLVAKGVLMEAYCIEYPEECTFCRFIYNVQDGVTIDYSTGQATEVGDSHNESNVKQYILNTSSLKFHLPTCESASKIIDKNKQTFTGTREELIANGYSPCGSCKP